MYKYMVENANGLKNGLINGFTNCLLNCLMLKMRGF